jgi:hypothetical protein
MLRVSPVAAQKPWAAVTPGWSARKGSAEDSWIDRFGKPWATVTPGWSARKGSAEDSWIDRFGVHPTAPPFA